jgi:hypothetical protein
MPSRQTLRTLPNLLSAPQPASAQPSSCFSGTAINGWRQIGRARPTGVRSRRPQGSAADLDDGAGSELPLGRSVNAGAPVACTQRAAFRTLGARFRRHEL